MTWLPDLPLTIVKCLCAKPLVSREGTGLVRRPLNRPGGKDRGRLRWIEPLEERRAPGCVLDILGLAVTEPPLHGGISQVLADVEPARGSTADSTATSCRASRSNTTELPTATGETPTAITESTAPSAGRAWREFPMPANELATETTGPLQDLSTDPDWLGPRWGLASADERCAGNGRFGRTGPTGNTVPGTFGLTPSGSALAPRIFVPNLGRGTPDGDTLEARWQSLGPGRLAAGSAPNWLMGRTQIGANVPAATGTPVDPGIPVQPRGDDLRLPRGLAYPQDTEVVQSLEPYAMTYGGAEQQPTTGVVRSPAEYDPVRGVLFSYTSYTSIVTDMVKELTEDAGADDIAYVVVSSSSQQTAATTSFTNAGADMSKVRFLIQPSNSVWIRDYGPHFVTVDDSLAIVDSQYYPNRPLDNFIPTLLGDNDFNLPTYDMGLYYSGGNFQPGPNRSGFVTSLVNYHNTATDGFTPSLISELYHTYQGIDTLHVMPQLPFSVDGTGHIDMWLYLVDEDTVVISEFKAGSNSTAIQITNNAVGYMQGLGFEVYRTPAWNAGSTHYTYANAFRVNDRIFMPVYGTALKPGGNPSYNDEDAVALATWQAAAGPGVEVIPIQSNQIIPAAGAIHCIVKQVPRYTASAPAANIISPAGGEVLLAGSTFPIEWSAIDTDNVDPVQIDIDVAYQGDNYHHLATTSDTGAYLWTVSGRGPRATIRIVARSADQDEVTVYSKPFTISRGTAWEYDFASGAGTNKFAFGWQTSSWADIHANMSPVSTPLSALAYNALASSNATGSDSDPNRYIAPVPAPLSNESTHVFEFQLAESITRMAQIDVHWEGYADYCTQVELYVWDRIAQDWGDATGRIGNNRYMDSWAGNADGDLYGSIRSDFSRYVGRSGSIRFLVYADRTGTNPDTQHNTGQGIETFHDYMSVTVKQLDGRTADLYL